MGDRETLGRSVVIGLNDPCPDPWKGTTEVEITPCVLGRVRTREALIPDLQVRYLNRMPTVFRLDPDVDLSSTTSDIAPYELGGEWTFVFERLRKAIWYNSYDARRGGPVWWWSRRAETLGARIEGTADVVLPDGRSVWIDGGPRQPLDLDRDVVHHETIQLGRLQTSHIAKAPRNDLAPDQVAAVAHPVGPARVIAPAGSGKTRVLTARMRHLIDDRGIEPEIITALAYNKRAAEEMRSRLPTAWAPSIRTFHSATFEILREARPGVAIINEPEVRARLSDLVRAVPQPNTDILAPYLDGLEDVRIGLVDPENVEDTSDDVPGFAEVFRKYSQWLHESNKTDFGDMIYGAIQALCADVELRTKWQSRCQHLLVDEFQDLTPAYLLLIRLLASPGLNVFGVGDDDQVIYGYQGATPGYLVEYKRLFPGAKGYALEVNYRCPSDVVTAASHLLTHNRFRIPKTIRPTSQSTGLEVESHRREQLATAVVDRIRGMLADGVQPQSIAILSRVNSTLLVPRVALAASDIPVAGGVGQGILGRTVTRAALAWIRAATNPDEIRRIDVSETLGRPSRGLGKAFASLVGNQRTFSLNDLEGLGVGLAGKQQRKWDQYYTDLHGAVSAASSTANLLKYLAEDVGLGASAALLDSGRSRAGGNVHGDDLTSLMRLAPLCPSASDFEGWLVGLLRESESDKGVVLSSVHKVKGLEWDHVIVFGVDSDTIPHRLADDIEEERRIFHVAITRGRKTVTILSEEGRVSPFIAEMRQPRALPPSVSTPKAPDSVRAPTDKQRPEIDPGRTGTTSPKGVIVNVRDRIRVRGGLDGNVAAISDHGVTVEFDTGTQMMLSWGEQVTRLKDGQAGPLRRASAQSTVERPAPEHDEPATRKALREWRLAKAREQGVPAFVIFNDRTLDELVARMPSNEQELLDVPGIGPAKLETYGDEILDIILQER